MKARVKSTGEIVEVDFHMETKRGKMFGEVTDSKRLCKPDSSYRKFYQDEIEFLSYEDTPDYWTRLEHTYAGMAMQGMVSNSEMFIELGNAKGLSVENAIAEVSHKVAHALVEKMKEKEERK